MTPGQQTKPKSPWQERAYMAEERVKRLKAVVKYIANLTGPCIERGACDHTLCCSVRECRKVLREVE